MAADKKSKTEKPTAKRIKKARSEGSVAKSPELFSWFSLLAATILMPILLGPAEQKIEVLFYTIPRVTLNPTTTSTTAMLSDGFSAFVLIVGPIIGGAALVAIIISVAQTGFGLFYKSITPKLSKVSPLKGIKKIFSPSGLTEVLKSFVKLVVVVGLGYSQVHGLTSLLSTNSNLAIGSVTTETAGIVLGAARMIAGFGLVIAVADYARQKKMLTKSLKMTKQEVKEENKDDQGDPTVKGRIRRMQMQMSRQRMMTSIAKSTVVVVNPTHFAVALSYNPKISPAPRVVAKGKDNIALLIKERASKNNIPIVRDAPLARALYVSTKIDDQIPFVLYKAVAKLIAFVFKLSAFAKSQEMSHTTPSAEIPNELLIKADSIA